MVKKVDISITNKKKASTPLKETKAVKKPEIKLDKKVKVSKTSMKISPDRKSKTAPEIYRFLTLCSQHNIPDKTINYSALRHVSHALLSSDKKSKEVLYQLFTDTDNTIEKIIFILGCQIHEILTAMLEAVDRNSEGIAVAVHTLTLKELADNPPKARRRLLDHITTLANSPKTL